ncbi:MAG: DUF6011 domain-containing protein, partial [Planctomycetota bacterium]
EQIEGRRNGELAWKLSNGEYVISYRGILTLAERHHITFEEIIRDDTHTVIAKGRCGTSERISGKSVNGSVETALALAQRSAARQLLPLAEIKAIEKKAQLESEFTWKTAYEKCVKVAGTKANVDIIINDLVKNGKLRADNPSGYNRTEYLLIYQACQKDDNNNGGEDNTPSSLSNDVDDLTMEDRADSPAFVEESYCHLRLRHACSHYRPLEEIHCSICSRKLTAPESRMLQVGPECRKRLGIKGLAYLQDNTNVISDELIEASKLYSEEQFRKWIIRACLTLDAPLPTKLLRWLGNEWFSYRKSPILYYLSADGQLNRIGTFNRKLRHHLITKETAEGELDSHAIRIAAETNGNGNGKRQLQMDQTFHTWIVGADGIRKPISCREICETFENKRNPSIITRLRAGIDAGADLSTVSLDN